MKASQIRKLAHDLDLNHREILARWMAEVRARSWRIGTGAGRGAVDGASSAARLTGQLEDRCAQVLRSLSEALGSARGLAAGSAELREPVQILSFTAGWMAGAGLGISDTLALIHGLGAALPGAPRSFLHALAVAACEAHQAAVVQGHGERRRDAMERAQVVCDLGQATPCLFLTGDPDRRAVDAAVGRVVTLALMRGAARVVVDCTALEDAPRSLPEAAVILRDYHQEMALHAEAPIRVVVCGVGEQDEAAALLREAGVELFADIADALEERT